jgi:hypothetical protein
MDDHLLRVSAAGEQAHGTVARTPPRDIRPDLDHFSGALEPENRRGTRRGRIVTLALEQISAVDSGGAYADTQLVGSERRRRHFADPECRFVAEMIENDSAHIGSECIVSGPNAGCHLLP